MLEYSIIAILSIALMLTHWRKNVWRRRYAGMQQEVEQNRRYMLMQQEAVRDAVVRLVQHKGDEWPETIDSPSVK